MSDEINVYLQPLIVVIGFCAFIFQKSDYEALAFHQYLQTGSILNRSVDQESKCGFYFGTLTGKSFDWAEI